MSRNLIVLIINGTIDLDNGSQNISSKNLYLPLNHQTNFMRKNYLFKQMITLLLGTLKQNRFGNIFCLHCS